MPFIQACKDIAADGSGRSPKIPLLITVASVLGVERLSPSVTKDLSGFLQRSGESQESPVGMCLAVGYVIPRVLLIPLQGRV